MNEEKRKKLAMVRAIMCILVIVIVILGWTGVINRVIGMVISTVLISVITIWNGVEALKSQQKKAAVFNFIMTAIILILCVGALILD